MREKIEIPEQGELEVFDRIQPAPDAEDYLAYRVDEGDIVPKMAGFGDGFRYHVTVYSMTKLDSQVTVRTMQESC